MRAINYLTHHAPGGRGAVAFAILIFGLLVHGVVVGAVPHGIAVGILQPTIRRVPPLAKPRCVRPSENVAVFNISPDVQGLSESRSQLLINHDCQWVSACQDCDLSGSWDDDRPGASNDCENNATEIKRNFGLADPANQKWIKWLRGAGKRLKARLDGNTVCRSSAGVPERYLEGDVVANRYHGVGNRIESYPRTLIELKGIPRLIKLPSGGVGAPLLLTGLFPHLVESLGKLNLVLLDSGLGVSVGVLGINGRILGCLGSNHGGIGGSLSLAGLPECSKSVSDYNKNPEDLDNGFVLPRQLKPPLILFFLLWLGLVATGWIRFRTSTDVGIAGLWLAVFAVGFILSCATGTVLLWFW